MTVYELAPGRRADTRRQTWRGRVQMLLVLTACAAPVVASYVAYFMARPAPRSNYGDLIQPSRTVPDVTARRLTGEAVPLRATRGQWLLLAAGPGTCDAACERLLHMQRQLREMMGRDRDRIDKVWLVTDEAALRPALADALQARPPVTVLRVDASAAGRWLEPATGQRLQDHLYLVDPMGEWMMRFPADAEPSKVKRDLDRLLRASSSWDRAGR